MKKVSLGKTELEKLSREDLVSRILSLHETSDDCLVSPKVKDKDSTSSVGSITGFGDDKLKQQQVEATRRENVLVMRLTTKEQEVQEYLNQLEELKQSLAGGYRSAMLDPAVNILFNKLKQELDSTKEKLEQSQQELNAWKFTPDSTTGKRLMAKCRMLIQENEDLGRMISSGRIAKLDGDIALARTFIDEMKQSQADVDDLLLENDEDMEAMQATIYYLQQQAQELKQENAELRLRFGGELNGGSIENIIPMLNSSTIDLRENRQQQQKIPAAPGVSTSHSAGRHHSFGGGAENVTDEDRCSSRSVTPVQDDHNLERTSSPLVSILSPVSASVTTAEDEEMPPAVPDSSTNNNNHHHHHNHHHAVISSGIEVDLPPPIKRMRLNDEFVGSSTSDASSIISEPYPPPINGNRSGMVSSSTPPMQVSVSAVSVVAKATTKYQPTHSSGSADDDIDAMEAPAWNDTPLEPTITTTNHNHHHHHHRTLSITDAAAIATPNDDERTSGPTTRKQTAKSGRKAKAPRKASSSNSANSSWATRSKSPTPPVPVFDKFTAVNGSVVPGLEQEESD